MIPKTPRIRRSSSGSSTDSSRTNTSRSAYPKGIIINGELKKRLSTGAIGRPKKSTNTIVDKKTAKLLSTIPKAALLTPSSSENSLTSSLSSNGGKVSSNVATEKKQKNVEEQQQMAVVKVAAPPPRAPPQKAPMPPYLTLKRQNTAAMLNYRARKSVSQMDFKEARRTGNYQLVQMPNNQLSPSCQADLPPSAVNKMMLFQELGGNIRFLVDEEKDPRIASLRIFNTIMLHAWRRRREDVRHLTVQLDDHKRSYVKNRNQLHVYNSLFSVEKRRNDSLNDQLRQSYRDHSKTKDNFDKLNILLQQYKEENQELLNQSTRKQEEIDSLQQLLQTSNQELFQATAQIRKQLEQLTTIQREYQQAEFEKQELANQLELEKVQFTVKLQQMDQLNEKVTLTEQQLVAATNELKQLHSSVDELEIQVLELEHYKTKSYQLEEALKESQKQVHTLQNCLAATLGQRIKQCFAQRQAYQHATYRMLHFVAFYMLPATPPPAIHIGSFPVAVSKLYGMVSTRLRSSGYKDDNEKSPIEE